MKGDVVLDASMFVAAVSPTEIHHAYARRRYRAHPEDAAFLVPALFRVEVLAALARRNEPAELLDTVDVLISSPRFATVAVDALLLQRAADVVRAARLRAYDAIYVALALIRGATLLTLDVEVRKKTTEAFPNLKVL